MHAAAMGWPLVQTGKPADPAVQATTSTGNGLMRPLEAAAKKAGVEILLDHRMTAHLPGGTGSGRVLGIAVDNKGMKINIRARKAVIIATGGSTGNVNFRRMFDPRLTEEYCGLAGMPWSDQDASGEIAAMAIGASLWGLYNQVGEFGPPVTKPGTIGCQYNYANLQWFPGSPVFKLARATGLAVANWQDLILVNMIGRRFYDETAGQFTANSAGQVEPYVHGSYLNARNIKYDPANFINAALAGIGDGKNGGGPIWAIFDADAAARERWNPTPPNVDLDEGFFFTANTIAGLASRIVMKHQRVPMPPKNLMETVARYNSFVDAGKDEDFGKPAPKHKIAKPPVLRGLGNARSPRHPRRPQDQRQMPGAGHVRPRHPRPLLRRRIRRRLQPARPCAGDLPGLHRRQACFRTDVVLLTSRPEQLGYEKASARFEPEP